MYDVFSLPDLKFPDGFVWGSATAGHQVEGDNINSHRWYEEQAGEYRVPSGKACNHYAMYKEDVEMIKNLGHQAYRMSVEWSRIEPSEGNFSTEALNHYIDLVSRLKESGVQVYLTLNHFTHPKWFEDIGCFFKMENIKYFERYVSLIAKNLGPYVDSWLVLNEFNMQGLPEGPRNALIKLNMLKYHARGYHVIKQYSKAPVSTAHAFMHYFPSRKYDRFDNTMTEYLDFLMNEFYLHAIRTGEIVYPFQDGEYYPELKGAADYWAVNYYTRNMVDSRKVGTEGSRFKHKELKMIPEDFYMEEMFPEGLTAILERLKDKPVYITENGCSAYDDRFRIVYIALHLSALKDAIDRGVEVKGYLHWSLMDNYEWQSFIPRFGLVHVDFDTFKRTPKPSAMFFKDIINQNGLTTDIIKKYLNELPTIGNYSK